MTDVIAYVVEGTDIAEDMTFSENFFDLLIFEAQGKILAEKKDRLHYVACSVSGMSYFPFLRFIAVRKTSF